MQLENVFLSTFYWYTFLVGIPGRSEQTLGSLQILMNSSHFSLEEKKNSPFSSFLKKAFLPIEIRLFPKQKLNFFSNLDVYALPHKLPCVVASVPSLLVIPIY